MFLKKSTAKFKHFSQFKITHINTWKHVKSYDNQNYCSQTLNRFVGVFFKELDLPLLWPILNFFSAQLKNLGNEWKNIGHIYVYVPSNCTSKLQTMDLSVQKTVKDHLRDQFETWYAEKVASILQAGDDIEINLGMSLLKLLSCLTQQ